MTLFEELNGKTRAGLVEWAEAHGIEVPEKIQKDDLLELILDSEAALVENYRQNTVIAVLEGCKARRIPDEGRADVFATIEGRYGVSLDEMNLPQLTRLNREMSDVFRAHLGGRKRLALSRQRPAGLRG